MHVYLNVVFCGGVALKSSKYEVGLLISPC